MSELIKNNSSKIAYKLLSIEENKLENILFIELIKKEDIYE